MEEKKCMKFSIHTLCVGDKVRIIATGKGEGVDERKTATVTGFGTHNIGDHAFTVPEFRTDDGVDLDGTQCWWIPIDEALKAEAFVSRMSEIEKVGNDNGN